MARCSNEQVAKILVSGGVVQGRAKDEDIELTRKIALVTEGFSTSYKYCKLVLIERDYLRKTL